MTVRALPHLRFKDPETQKAYDAIREALQEGNGERGDPNNRWLTVADLDGAITQRINVVSSGGDTPTTPTDPEDPVTPNPPTPGGDGLDPLAPINLTATSDAWAIRLTWEQPADMPADYDVTEIWCRNATSGDKLYAGALRGNQFVFTGLDDHLLRNDETWYFWVRNKDIEDRFSTYCPANDVGVEGKAKESPEGGIGGLIGDITEGTLWDYLGAKIRLLQGPEGIPNSVQARLADQYDALVQRINEVTVSGNGTIDPIEIWFFDASAQGWTGSSATVTWASGAITALATAINGELISPVLATPIDGSKYPAIRVRSQQLAGTEWVKGLKFRASGATTWYTYTPPSPPLNGPTYEESGYSDTDWDLSANTDWTGNSIAQLAFVLEESGQELKFDWVAVGRIAPGASYAQVEAVRVLSDKKNRSFFVPNSGAPNYAGPSNPYSDGYVLKEYDLWFDTATAVYDGTTGALLRGGNKPYRWSGTAWAETTDTRLADSWADIWELKQAAAVGNQSVAQWISGIGVMSAAADEAIQSKAWRTDTETYYAGGGYTSLSSRLSGMESSVSGKNKVFIQSSIPTPPVGQAIGDLWYDTTDANRVLLKRWDGSPPQWVVQRTDTKVYYVSWASRPTTNNLAGDLLYATDQNNKPYIWSITTNPPSWVPVLDNYINTNISASINEMQRARIGYATINVNYTGPNNVVYPAGSVFDGNGSTDIYPIDQYPDATFPQYKLTRKTIIDEVGVLNWNAAFPLYPATWRPGLPLATAIKQVRVSDGTDSLTIEQQFTAKKNIDNQLLGQYSVKIDNNGWVSGFGLASQSFPDGKVVSDFGVRADRFWIGSPENPVTAIVRDLVNLGGSAVIKTVQGRLTPTGPNEWFAVLQTATAHGLATNEWFTLKDIRATANTTNSDNLHPKYNGSWVAAAVGRGSIYDTTGKVYDLSQMGVTNSSNVVIFRIPYNLLAGYTTTQTAPPYNDPSQLVPNKSIPFIVTTTTQRYNNADIPAGVFMNAAYISDATITNAKIADAAITMAKITKVIQSANFNGDFKANGDLDPANPGTTGWAIDQPGTAILNSLIVRTQNIATNAVNEVIAGGNYTTITLTDGQWTNPIDLAQTLPANTNRGKVLINWVISLPSSHYDKIGVGMEVLRNGVKLGGNDAFFYGKGACHFHWVDDNAGTAAVVYTLRVRWYPLTLPYPSPFPRAYFASIMDVKR